MADFETVRLAALSLDREGRQHLLDDLARSLERDWESAWLTELDRRSQFAREHPETVVDWEELEAELFNESSIG